MQQYMPLREALAELRRVRGTHDKLVIAYDEVAERVADQDTAIKAALDALDDNDDSGARLILKTALK